MPILEARRSVYFLVIESMRSLTCCLILKAFSAGEVACRRAEVLLFSSKLD